MAVRSILHKPRILIGNAKNIRRAHRMNSDARTEMYRLQLGTNPQQR